jgi:RNA-directed DNA polymerase
MDQVDIENLVFEFKDVQTLRELASCLRVEYKILTYHLYRVKDENKYNEFEIKKRNGGIRKIIAPISGIKLIQSTLNLILQNLFSPKSSVHGFTLNKSIKSNASSHVKKRIVVNLDLKDFFPTINFGRVRGLFLSYPFYFKPKVATALAQICCHKNALPQGAPTSPIISNFICRRLDNEMMKLVSSNKSTYTRYADDITISTNLKKLPPDIGTIIENKLILSERLLQTVQSNGFIVNPLKTRFAFRTNRQEVTGLIVNKLVNVNRKYIRHIRAMLHSWEKFGITLAASEHFNKYNVKNKTVSVVENSFKNELIGKVGFVGFIKGKDNEVYRKLLTRFGILAPEVQLKIVQNEIEQETNPIVFGEGRTDWRHLKKAFEVLKKKGFYRNLFLKFHEYSHELEINNDQLLNICKGLPKTDFSNKKVICLFDRDAKKIRSQVTEQGKPYKNWGKDVYSLLMPIPPHRNFEEICIEHYYSDDDLLKLDSNGRRIYLSNEFDSSSGVHLTEMLTYKTIKVLKAKYPRILDYNVINDEGKNVALSKTDFSKYILNETPPFNGVTFDNFKFIFDEIERIINTPGSR